MQMSSLSHVPNGGKFHTRLLADGGLLLLIAIWWNVSRGVPSYVLPSPMEVSKDLVRFIYDPALLGNFLATLTRVFGAVAISTALGTVLAIMTRWWPWSSRIVEDRIVPFINAIPSIGWAIVGVIWFDVSNLAVMFVQVAILLPFYVVNVLAGLKSLDNDDVVEMGRSFTKSRVRLYWKITLPLLAPLIFASARMALGMAWKLSLVSELFGASSGLGVVMLNAQETGDASLVMATCCVIVVAYVLSDRMVMGPLATRLGVNPVLVTRGGTKAKKIS